MRGVVNSGNILFFFISHTSIYSQILLNPCTVMKRGWWWDFWQLKVSFPCPAVSPSNCFGATHICAGSVADTSPCCSMKADQTLERVLAQRAPHQSCSFMSLILPPHCPHHAPFYPSPPHSAQALSRSCPSMLPSNPLHCFTFSSGHPAHWHTWHVCNSCKGGYAGGMHIPPVYSSNGIGALVTVRNAR